MKYFTAVIFLLALVSCKAKNKANIPNTQTVQLLKLGDAVEENTTLKNIAGYTIAKKIKVTKTQQNDLVKEINNSSNVEIATRKCSFQPAYAVLVNDRIYAIFDTEFCPKIKLTQSNNSDIMDLKENNKLKELINSIIKK